MKHNDEKGTWREIPCKEENEEELRIIRKALRKRKVHVDMLILLQPAKSRTRLRSRKH